MNSSTFSISKREREVLELTALGNVSKQIANQLNICETTVITHKENLKRRFHVSNSCELVYVATKNGFI